MLRQLWFDQHLLLIGQVQGVRRCPLPGQMRLSRSPVKHAL